MALDITYTFFKFILIREESKQVGSARKENVTVAFRKSVEFFGSPH